MAYPHETDEHGVVVNKNVNANKQAGEPEEAPAVTGRPNDLTVEQRPPALANSTLASRRRLREEAETKALSGEKAENKAVKRATTKAK